MPDDPKLIELTDLEVTPSVPERKTEPLSKLIERLRPQQLFFCNCGAGFDSQKGLLIHCRLNAHNHYPAIGLWSRPDLPKPVFYKHSVPDRDIRDRAITKVFILATVPRYDGVEIDPIPVHPQTYAELRRAKRVIGRASSKANPRYEKRKEDGRWQLMRRGQHLPK